MARGQPTKYKPEYCQLIIEHLKGGKSIETFPATIDVSRDSIYEWEKKHPDFSYSIKKARMLSQDHYENLGYMGMTGLIEGFNATVWIFIMKNRFGWRDKTEITAPQEEAEFVDG